MDEKTLTPFDHYCDFFSEENVIYSYELGPDKVAVVLANRDEVIFEYLGNKRWILKSHDQWLEEMVRKDQERRGE